MRYSLTRLRDGAGDSGYLSTAIRVDHDAQTIHHEENARPQVGVIIRVGSVYARTYGYQDFWQTTEITEILEDTPELVTFRTKNGSVYEWRVI
jgi:hypothetical protein